MPTDAGSWIAILAGVCMICALWSLSRPRWNVKIVVSHAGVQYHRGLPKAQVSSIVRFFEQDVSIDGRVVVLATRDTNGRLRTRVTGHLDPGSKQRIRNFLLVTL